jgi:hypothetical protein
MLLQCKQCRPRADIARGIIKNDAVRAPRPPSRAASADGARTPHDVRPTENSPAALFGSDGLLPRLVPKVSQRWRGLLQQVSEAYQQQVCPAQLLGVYLRGSLARGTEVSGLSDVDTFALWLAPGPDEAAAAEAQQLEQAILASIEGSVGSEWARLGSGCFTKVGRRGRSSTPQAACHLPPPPAIARSSSRSDPLQPPPLAGRPPWHFPRTLHTPPLNTSRAPAAPAFPSDGSPAAASARIQPTGAVAGGGGGGTLASRHAAQPGSAAAPSLRALHAGRVAGGAGPAGAAARRRRRAPTRAAACAGGGRAARVQRRPGAPCRRGAGCSR